MAGQERTWIANLPARRGEAVVVAGWVERVRDLGGIRLVRLRDATGTVQVAWEPARDPLPAGPPTLPPESVVAVRGRVVAEPRAPGGLEVRADHLDLLNPAGPLPFEVNRPELRPGLDVLLDHRMLSLRHPSQRAVVRLRAALAAAFRAECVRHGFTEIHTPKLVAAATEGGAECFPVGYLERQACLAQSPQLCKQLMVGAGLERVFEVGPAFRAEPHDTARHLNEFTSLDVEMGFIRDERDLLAFETGLLRAMFEAVGEACAAELAALRARVPEVGEIPAVPLEEAQALLARRFRKPSPAGGLDADGERLLCQFFREEAGTELVFVTRYPVEQRPFYAMPCPEAPGLSCSFDLLFRGLEVTTGGQRIHDPDLLEAGLVRRGLDPAAFGAYLEAFRQGMPPHGGFAIGLERLVGRLAGLDNVRLAALFPRDRNRLEP